jgi:hypothetical protein
MVVQISVEVNRKRRTSLSLGLVVVVVKTGKNAGVLFWHWQAAAVLRRMDRSAEFVHHLDSLRVKYKIKRNFIKLVEQKRKALYLP